MYKFKRIKIPGFQLVEAHPLKGDTHLKKFLQKTTPLNQGTMNLYLEGEFELTIPEIGYSQIIQSGNTNLDINLAEFPINTIVTERVVSDTGWRLCLSPEEITARWTRNVNIISPDQIHSLSQGEIIIVLTGSIQINSEIIGLGGVYVADNDVNVSSTLGAKFVVIKLV
jgi:hypothetical protein